MDPSIQKDFQDDSGNIATFAGGCFWCIEAEFRRLPGVLSTTCGYEGGQSDNPTYEDVCTGKTGHAEVLRVGFDPAVISYEALLDHFLRLAHDPTDAEGQGVDKGTQYRSAIFYHDEAQKRLAQEAIAKLDAEKYWKKPIVTTLEPHGKFYPAEEYHQNYYETYEAQRGAPHIRYLYKQRKWARQGR